MLPSRNDTTDPPPSSARDNPYAPPGAAGAPAVDASSAIAPYARIAAIGQVLGACLGGFLGLVQTIQYGYGLSRFGGLTYVARVVSLSTVRALGSGAALLVTAMSSAIVLHRAGRRATTAAILIVRDRSIAWLAISTVATFVVVCALTTVFSALTAAAVYGVSVSTFLAQGWRGITRGDMVHGAALAAVDGVLCVAFVPLVARWLASPHRGLVLKVFVTYAAVQATTVLEQTVLGLIDR